MEALRGSLCIIAYDRHPLQNSAWTKGRESIVECGFGSTQLTIIANTINAYNTLLERGFAGYTGINKAKTVIMSKVNRARDKRTAGGTSSAADLKNLTFGDNPTNTTNQVMTTDQRTDLKQRLKDFAARPTNPLASADTQGRSKAAEERERQATDLTGESLEAGSLSDDGTGKEDIITTVKFTIDEPLQGKFTRRNNRDTKWLDHQRYYQIEIDGKLKYYYYKWMRTKDTNATTLDLAKPHTIEILQKPYAFRIVIGTTKETIKVTKQFLTHMVAMYTELSKTQNATAIENLGKIKAFSTRKTRRRMAQREFSSRRDSPVMTRLLEEIIAAQDK